MKSSRFGVLVASLCVTATLFGGVQQRRAFPLALCLTDLAEFPTSETDIMGCRLCLIYGRHANVSGVDLGVIGCAVDGCLFGLQLSSVLNDVGSANGTGQLAGIANNCSEDFCGFQIAGIANNTQGGIYGAQIGSFNMAKEMNGTQIGVFNKAENAVGIQLAVINWATEMKGIQLGVINVIEKSPVPYMPVLNMCF